MKPFSGSYDAKDTMFLLKPMSLDMVDVVAKERLIQSGQRHYSEMLSPEQVPDAAYLRLFEDLTAHYAQRLAIETLALARHLAMTRPHEITIVSLARAGTPIGALLVRALRWLGRRDAQHYSISIIRDRGIDENALRYMLHAEKRLPSGLAFVDGWTAKGVISKELRQALHHWNARHREQLSDALYVISDIGGVADVAATYDDYAIPSGILNATVSGLTSRSILNERIGPTDFHGCVFYQEFASQDRSAWFLDQISAHFADGYSQSIACDIEQRHRRRAAMAFFLGRLHEQYHITDRNFIKPGVAEATRVLLRRLPELLLLRDPHQADVAHLRLLAEQKQVRLVVDPMMPIQATALIQDLA